MNTPKGLPNGAVRLPAGPRIWDTEVAGGRMHTIVDGRAVVVPTRADLAGKVREFSTDGKERVAIGRCAKYCRLDEREPFCFFCDQSGPRHGYWPFARIYRKDRP